MNNKNKFTVDAIRKRAESAAKRAERNHNIQITENGGVTVSYTSVRRMNMLVEVNGKAMEFIEASDGWFENKEEGLAINPSKSFCVTDPWNADFISPAPTHDFNILSE